MSKKAAVIASQGIGDALLMMVASHRLLEKGFEVTTFHPVLDQLKSWFEGHIFADYGHLNDVKELTRYNLIIAQNDNGERTKRLVELYRKGTLRNLSVFYPGYEPQKNDPLTSWDRVFDKNRSMVSNISESISSLLQTKDRSTNNGLKPPNGLTYRKYQSRVLIHPTSREEEKCWIRERFLHVATQLKEKGFTPVFSVSPSERPDWTDLEKEGWLLPEFPSLADLASFLYESGYVIGNDSAIGHLASNMKIPTVILADCRKRMKLWCPGWLKGKVLTPPTWLPNFKGSRYREKHWKRWISSQRVLKAFFDIVRKEGINC